MGLNNQQLKKQAELIHIGLWQKLSAGVPSGRIVVHESPDFLLMLNKRMAIGIELTRLAYPAGKSDLSLEWFAQQLESTIARKSELLAKYSANPQIAAQWLVIVCDDEYYRQVHRFLERAGRLTFYHGFGRIDLLFPLSEKVVNLFFAG